MGRGFASLAAFALIAGFLIPRVAAAGPRSPSKGAAKGATITVDTSADEQNNDGNCSLREAVDAANTDSAVDNCTAGSGTDTIVFSSSTNNHPIDLTQGSLDVSTNMTIDGNGVGTTTVTGDEIDTSGAAETVKDMTLDLVNNEPGSVTIDNIKATDEMNNNSTGTETSTMTISNSTLADVTNNSGFDTSKTVMTITDSTAGFIDSNSGFGTSSTSLTLDGVTASGVSNNSGGGTTTTGDISNSDIGSDGITASGSDSSSTVTVTDTSVTGTGSNEGIDVEDATVTVTGTTITGFDEGIFSDGPTTTLTNSTVTGLSSEGLAVGGGTFDVTNSTITNGQTGIDSFGGTITITNTIVAGFSEEGDCSGTVKSGGGNIADDGTCNLNGTGDQENTDPKLGSLQDNGARRRPSSPRPAARPSTRD